MIAISTIKKALKVDYTTDDQELLRIRDAVIALVTDYTGVTLESQSKVQYLPYFMRTRLIHTPFNEVSSVKYTNTAGTVVTMPATDWFIIRSEFPSIYINFREFPTLKEGTEVEITYKVGYSVLPGDVQQLIISLIGHWYNNPEAGAPISLSTVPLSAQFIMDNMSATGSVE